MVIIFGRGVDFRKVFALKTCPPLVNRAPQGRRELARLDIFLIRYTKGHFYGAQRYANAYLRTCSRRACAPLIHHDFTFKTLKFLSVAELQIFYFLPYSNHLFSYRSGSLEIISWLKIVVLHDYACLTVAPLNLA